MNTYYISYTNYSKHQLYHSTLSHHQTRLYIRDGYHESITCNDTLLIFCAFCLPNLPPRAQGFSLSFFNQHQFSPSNIHMLPRKMVMRVNKMITEEKML